MEVILHIGTTKTGTSTIQLACHKSRRRLQDDGIFYPAIGSMNRHSILSVPFYRTQVPREFWRDFGSEKQAVDKVSFGYWDSIAEDCQKMKPERLLLSGEHFLKIDLFEDFAAFFRERFEGAKLRAVCYLRNPVQFYVSAFQQIIKASSRIAKPQNEMLASALSCWQEVCDELVIREFNRDTLEGGDLLADFFHHGVCHPSALEDLVRQKRFRANETLSAESMIILQKFRRYNFPNEDNIFNDESIWLVNALRRAEENIPQGMMSTPPAPVPEVVHDIIKESRPDLVELANKFSFRFLDDTIYTREVEESLKARYLRVEDIIAYDPEVLHVLWSKVLKEAITKNATT